MCQKSDKEHEAHMHTHIHTYIRTHELTGRKIQNSSLTLASARSTRNGVEVIKNITAGLIKTGHLVSPHRTDRSRVQITPP